MNNLPNLGDPMSRLPSGPHPMEPDRAAVLALVPAAELVWAPVLA